MHLLQTRSATLELTTRIIPKRFETVYFDRSLIEMVTSRTAVVEVDFAGQKHYLLICSGLREWLVTKEMLEADTRWSNLTNNHEPALRTTTIEASIIDGQLAVTKIDLNVEKDQPSFIVDVVR